MIKDLFTEKDGVSFCPVRAGFIIGMLIFFGLTFMDLYTCTTFSFMEHAKDWLTGLATYLGLGGAAIAGKNATEKAD